MVSSASIAHTHNVSSDARSSDIEQMYIIAEFIRIKVRLENAIIFYSNFCSHSRFVIFKICVYFFFLTNIN